jgi:hypothetical protein
VIASVPGIFDVAVYRWFFPFLGIAAAFAIGAAQQGDILRRVSKIIFSISLILLLAVASVGGLFFRRANFIKIVLIKNNFIFFR